VNPNTLFSKGAPAMKLRVVVVLFLVMLSVLAFSLTAVAQPSTPASLITHPSGALRSSTELTHTGYLPLLMGCFPSLKVDPYFDSHQDDMAVIHADVAWRSCTVRNGYGITIAIIDTGVDLTHSDLEANLVAGYDFVDKDGTPQDGEGHGTNVAGIAAAALNGIGVSGVAPSAKILPVRVLDDAGYGSYADIAAGITYAADRAQVLNLSLGGAYDDPVLAAAINYAVNTKGRLVVAAAGNCGYYINRCDYQNQPLYPAAYANVLAVAATDNYDAQAYFSNSGSYVDVSAPGVEIYSTFIPNSYHAESGTSQATPHVAGLAALIWANYPTYTASQVWNRITSTSVDLGTPGRDNIFGAGRIDVKQALGITLANVNEPAAPLKQVEPVAPIDHRAAPIAAGHVTVKFKSTGHASQTLQQLSDVVVIDSINGIDAQVLQVPVGQEWQVVDQLRTLPGVEYAEPDYVITIQ
jgi:subtilisin family serine protease